MPVERSELFVPGPTGPSTSHTGCMRPHRVCVKRDLSNASVRVPTVDNIIFSTLIDINLFPGKEFRSDWLPANREKRHSDLCLKYQPLSF